VLAGAWPWCAAVDVASGALVRARWAGQPTGRWAGGGVLDSYDVVVGRVAADQGVPDAARPESVVLDGPPRVVGRIRPRQAERWLRPLLHPRREPILGLAGPAAPYWTLSGDRPSLSLVAPGSRLLLYRVAAGAFCRFRWRDRVHQLPLTPTAAHRVPGRPRRLLVALTAPLDGYCHKVVAAVL